MNTKDRMIARSDHFRLLRMGQKRNCVRLNSGNTLLHELEKTKVCYQLQQMGMEYVTEAEFTTGGRADIFVLDTGDVIEILHSEKKADCVKKTSRYPKGLPVTYRTTRGEP